MITYNGEQVGIIAGERKDRLATIEWVNGMLAGKVRVVPVERLKGTKGGTMEVIATWSQVCRATKALEEKR